MCLIVKREPLQLGYMAVRRCSFGDQVQQVGLKRAQLSLLPLAVPKSTGSDIRRFLTQGKKRLIRGQRPFQMVAVGHRREISDSDLGLIYVLPQMWVDWCTRLPLVALSSNINEEMFM